MTHTISKSQYLKGDQCLKALWLYHNRKDLAPKIAPATHARFDTVHETRQWAMQYFSTGVEVTQPYLDIKGAIAATEQFVQDGHKIIFEAAAMHPVNDCYSRIDILRRVEGSEEWDIIDVKSATSIKDYHYDDMGFQDYVFHKAGYKIRKCFMMLIDNRYVRQGSIDPQKLLKLEDISEVIFAERNEIETMVGKLENTLNKQAEPDISIGAHCFEPFDCDYRPYCWNHVPDYSVYDIFDKTKAEDLANECGLNLADLSGDDRPEGAMEHDVDNYFNGNNIFDSANLKAFLGQLQYPLYFLDYETIMPSIPLFDGTRPYQQIPCQFSVHIQAAPNAAVIHHGFLHKQRSDPRRDFIEQLIKLCGQDGKIIVYNRALEITRSNELGNEIANETENLIAKNSSAHVFSLANDFPPDAFEITRNNELAKDFPQYASKIKLINKRIVDLWEPFNKRWLYHLDQKSSVSLKAVLPCFTSLSSKDLEIGHRGEAMLQYEAFMNGKLQKNELPSLWNNLDKYCQQDTYAMKLLLDHIKVNT